MADLTMNLRAGTDQHKIVLDALEARIKFSERKMHDRLEAWRKADNDSTAYIKETEADQKRRLVRESEGRPQATTILVPYTYAMHMASWTYWTTVFLGRDPVFQYTSTHGEPFNKVDAVQALIAYQTLKGRMLAPQYTWLYDVGKYGIGIVGNYWEEEKRYVCRITERTEGGVFGIGAKTVRGKEIQTLDGYKGNKLFNIRPHDYRPDPRVTLTDPDKGEFVGWLVDIPWTDVWTRALDGSYIKENVEKLEAKLKGSSSATKTRDAGGAEVVLPELGDNAGMATSTMHANVPAVQIVVRLIPKQWKLGQSERPEKWVFTYARDHHLLLEARPLGLYHDRFPVQVIEMEAEGYSLFKRGIYDIGRPMNDLLTWLFNSHLYSVRKALNGEIVYDPSRLTSKDLMDYREGKRIRVKPRGYGQDVRSMFTTIQGTGDVTGEHLKSAQGIMALMQQVLGINENIMGSASSSSRRSATEVRQSNSASINRLKTIAEYVSATGYTELGSQLLQNSQQLYDDELKLRLVGDQPRDAQAFLNVTPQEIAGDYDFVPVDGTLPIDNMAMVNMWGSLLSQLRTIPGGLDQYNMPELIAWIAQRGGLKNIKQFRLQPVADDQLQQEIQRGNVRPVPGTGGGGGQPRDRATADARGDQSGDGGGQTRPPAAQQIPGVGTTS